MCSIQLSYGNVYFIVFIPYAIRTSVLNEVFVRRLLVHYLRRRTLYPTEVLGRAYEIYSRDVTCAEFEEGVWTSFVFYSIFPALSRRVMGFFAGEGKGKNPVFCGFLKFPLYIQARFRYNKSNYANTTK